MIEKMLCATDGSHSAREAVNFAAFLARQCDAHVAFVVVNTVTEEKLRTMAGWNSEEILSKLTQVDESGVTFTDEVRCGANSVLAVAVTKGPLTTESFARGVMLTGKDAATG